MRLFLIALLLSSLTGCGSSNNVFLPGYRQDTFRQPSTDEAPVKQMIRRTLKDSTGQTFESVFEPPSELKSLNGDPGKESIGTLPSHSDAQGVIVELEGESLAVTVTKAKKNGKDEAHIRELSSQRREELRVQHIGMKKKIAKVFAKELIGFSSVSRKGTIRTEHFTKALNAMALYDVSIKDAKSRLEGIQGVKAIYPNIRVTAEVLDSVPMISADQAWAYQGANGYILDGTGTRIGIIDTGIDYTHPDLGGCLGQACKVRGGYDFVNNDSDPKDDHGHGTHVAATAAGNGHYTDSTGMVHPLLGVAPGAALYAFKVLAADGSGYEDKIIKGIEACADPNGDGLFNDHLDVCNMSLGGRGNPDDPMSKAIDRITALGVVFTISAGNSGPTANSIGSPGTSRSAITVAAACKNKDIGVNGLCALPIASFSSRGPVTWTDTAGTEQQLQKPDISAPGVNICAAEYANAWSTRRCLDGTHVSLSGTSMAAPHVAGVAALMRQAHPELSPSRIKSVLQSSAGTLQLDPTIQGAGLVDTMTALQMVGLPTSIAIIQGNLTFIDDPVGTKISTLSKTLSITNNTGQSLSYSISRLNPKAGLSVSFNKTGFSLTPGQTEILTCSVVIDHSVIQSLAVTSEDLLLSSSLGQVKIPLRVSSGVRLTSSPATIDLGTDIPTSPTWSKQVSLSFQNTISDLGSNYDVTLNCCSVAGATPRSEISASVSPTSLSLTPGGSGSLSLQVTVSNTASLVNGLYEGYVLLSSPFQTTKVPIRFVKGYPVTIEYPDSMPTHVKILSKFGHRFMTDIPSWKKKTASHFILDFPGPYQLLATWWKFDLINSTVFPNGAGVIVLKDLSSTYPINTSLSEREGIYEMDFCPLVGPDGKRLCESSGYASSWYLFSQIVRKRDSQDLQEFMNILSPNGCSSIPPVVRISQVTSDWAVMNRGEWDAGSYANSKSIRLFEVVLKDGLNASFTAINSAADWGLFHTVGYSPSGAVDIIGGGTVQSLLYSENRWYRSGSVVGGVPGELYPVWNYDRTPMTDFSMVEKSHLNYGISLRLQDSVKRDLLASSPLLSLGPDSLLAWTGSSNVPVPLPPFPNRIISLGEQLLMDATSWQSVSNTNKLSLGSKFIAYYELTSRHLRGGFSTTGFLPSLYSYELTRDATPVLSMNGAASLGVLYFSDASPGNYRWRLVRESSEGGLNFRSETNSTFRLPSDYLTRPIDTRPPALQGLHLVANNTWQSRIDPSVANFLSFDLDPVPGEVNYQKLTDAIVSAAAAISSDGGTNWTALLAQKMADGSYLAPLPLSLNASAYKLKVSASDLAGNTFTYVTDAFVGKAQTPPTDPRPSPSPSASPSPSPSPSPTPSPSPSASPSPSPSPSPTPSPSQSPMPSVPDSPTNLKANVPPNGQRRIVLTWSDNSNNELGFKIERSSNGSAFQQVGSVGVGVTTYSQSQRKSGLVSNTVYRYRVKAYNAAGSSVWSNEVETILR